MNYLHGDEVISLPDGAEQTIRTRTLPDGDLEIDTGTRIFRVPIARDEKGAIHIFWQGRSYVFTPATQARRTAVKKSGSLSAPMTGVVVDVLVAVGDIVEAYQPVAVIEAMKVLATLESPVKGTVAAVHFHKGERVEHGAVVVELEELP
jgi:biotin carboxyl carrier protein